MKLIFLLLNIEFQKYNKWVQKKFERTKYFKLILFSKFFIIIPFIYFSYFSKKYDLFLKKKVQALKVCICTLAKNENKYINEFVEFYKNYGVDKIYLFDNNDIDGERFDNVIGKYIKNKFVEVIDWRGINGNSSYYGIMDSCYQQYHNLYDWLIFYEIDEFLYLKNYKNVKSYLIRNKFNKCESIQLNWVHMSDNNYLYYENKSLSERFPKKGKNVLKHHSNGICYIKTMIKGHLKNINITHNHYLSEKVKACDGFGRKINYVGILSLRPDYDNYYIKHYYGKSVQEFVDKINRGDLLRGNNKEIVEWAIKKFFFINEITLEKIKYIQKAFSSRYNLSIYIEALNKQI